MFSIFTFKSELEKVFNNERVQKLKDFIVQEIKNYVTQDLLGAEKKRLVINATILFIAKNFVTKNAIVGFFVKLLIKFIPNIVQYLYDALKEFVEDLTEKTA